MKIVIDIDEEDWKDINDIHFIREDLKFKIGKAIMKGKPLPTKHGRLIDEDFVLRNASSIRTVMDVNNAPTIIEGSEN